VRCACLRTCARAVYIYVNRTYVCVYIFMCMCVKEIDRKALSYLTKGDQAGSHGHGAAEINKELGLVAQASISHGVYVYVKSKE